MSQGRRLSYFSIHFVMKLTACSAASVMKDEQGRPFIVVREYVLKGWNRSLNSASEGPSEK